MKKGNDWQFDIQETANLANLGLAVLTNGKRKLYLKPIRLTREQKIAYKKFGIDPSTDYEFEPLSTDQLRKAGVQETLIEESQNKIDEDAKEMFIEESEAEEPKKKETHIDLAKEEDRQKLKDALKKAEQVYSDQPQKEPDPIEKLSAENQDLKEKMAIIAEHQLTKKMDALNIPESEREDYRKNPSMLQGYERALQKQRNQEFTDSVPSEQLNRSAEAERGFSSIGEMIEYLQNSDDPANKEKLDQIWLKTMRGFKNATPQEKEQILKGVSSKEDNIEAENKSGSVVDVVIRPHMRKPKDSELAKFTEKNNARRRMELGLEQEREEILKKKKEQLKKD